MERPLRQTLSALAAGSVPGTRVAPALAARPLALVRLAALLASDAATESIVWAAERATATGAADDELIAVLAAVASCADTVSASDNATRLAAALGYGGCERVESRGLSQVPGPAH